MAKAVPAREKEELVIIRTFDSPRKNVWKAWTTPECLMKWWGPVDYTAPFVKIDFTVGGKYLICMRSPDGVDVWSTGTYKEIVPYKRIVATDSFSDEKGNIVPASRYGMSGPWPLELLVTVTFEEKVGKTTMILRHSGIPDQKTGELMKDGWETSFNKLARVLWEDPSSETSVSAPPGTQEIVITRIFDAPREQVFQAMTDPHLVPDWWGPDRFTTIVEQMEARPGGLWKYIHRDAQGNEYAFHGVYHEVTFPSRTVRTMEFEGMPGHVLLETGKLEDIGGRTKFTGKSIFESIEDRDGMFETGGREGSRSTMERLAKLVEKER